MADITAGITVTGAQVRWVQQEDPMGCWVAAMAMVTGKTYTEVKAETGTTWERGGHCWKTDQYLAQNGFASARYFDSDQFHQLPPNEHGACMNERWAEWPLKPFAPIHVCSVQTSMAHCVVLLADGTVLDPNTPEPRRLTEYSRVIEMVGIWRVTADSISAPFPPGSIRQRYANFLALSNGIAKNLHLEVEFTTHSSGMGYETTELPCVEVSCSDTHEYMEVKGRVTIGLP